MTRIRQGWRGAVVLALLVSLISASAALWAAEAGPLKYRGGDQGAVIFEHRMHTSKAYTCRDCHTTYKPTGTQLFQTQKQGRISMDDHGSGTKCFACHDDKTAFFSSCDKCHRK